MEEKLKELKGIIRNYVGRRYHVIGIGRSGVGAANLLHELGADVRISDRNEEDAVRDYLQGVHHGVRIFAGVQDKGLVADIDCLVLSPGVPFDSDIVGEAKKNSIEVVGEIELGYRVIRQLSDETGLKVKWFGITGTNGKSTTATLLYEILKREGRNCELAGNIGHPLSVEALRILKDVIHRGRDVQDLDIVLELSSFQLETVKRFKLDVSALLNVTDDHLDRHTDFSHYAETKAEIFVNQSRSDFAVINADDEVAVRLSERTSAQKFFVSTTRNVVGGFVRDDSVFLKTTGDEEMLITVSDIKIIGLHNLYNALTASVTAHIVGTPKETIVATLKEFPGLAHRLEFVSEINGVAFYNDSKGTNVAAVIKSLQSFDSGVILIAGGSDKNSDFSALVPYVKGRVKKIVSIGETADKIKNDLGNVVAVENAGTLRDAVMVAYNFASSGDTVLLSPACASFDMFRNFEERGQRFKDIVDGLSRGN